MAVVDGTNAGFVTSAPTADPAGTNTSTTIDNNTTACNFTTPAGNFTVSEMGWYCDGATEEANFQVGVYSDNAGHPNARIGTSGDVAKGTGAGWKTGTVSLTQAELGSSTQVWLSAQLDNTATSTLGNYSTGAGYNMEVDFATASLLDPWGTTAGTSTDRIFAIYALYAASGTTLTVAELISASTIDNISLAQLHTLIINALESSSSLDQIVFKNIIALYILLSLAMERKYTVEESQQTYNVEISKDHIYLVN